MEREAFEASRSRPPRELPILALLADYQPAPPHGVERRAYPLHNRCPQPQIAGPEPASAIV